MQGIKISVYLLAFVLANYLVIWFGSVGLIFTALFLIPFDFVMRCIFHENYKGFTLILFMSFLVSIASMITYQINQDHINIAKGSAIAFILAQIGAGLFYQLTIKKRLFIKVNGSDFIGIMIDSTVFQIVAFGVISPYITAGQIAMKVAGGLFWYWLLFVKFKMKINEN